MFSRKGHYMLQFWLIHFHTGKKKSLISWNATFRGQQNLHTVALILVNYITSVLKNFSWNNFTVSAHRTSRCRRDSSLNITLPHRNSWCNIISLFCKFLGWSSGIVHKYFPYSIDSINVKFSAMFTWECRQIPAFPARLRLTVSYQFPLWILSSNRSQITKFFEAMRPTDGL